MKTILITGAGSGLGKELALEFARHQNTIILIGRNEQKLKEVQAKIEGLGQQAYSFILDISQNEQVEQTMQTIISRHSPSMLINNAGIGAFGRLEDISIADIHRVIDTNVKGTIFMTKAILPYFSTLPQARIMNIISTAGLKGKIAESVYVASKFAIRGFSESLMKELEESPISVSSIYMGGMDTPFWENTEHIKDTSRLRSPERVATTIYKLAEKTGDIILE